MKIFLHIGNYKTGSTAIQSFLSSRSAEFAEAGFHIPASGSAGNAQHGWAQSLLKRPGARDADELFAEIAAELEACPHDTAIVSSEVFFNGFMVEELLKRLTGHSVTVIAYLRRQDEFASAYYMQLIQHPNFMESAPPRVEYFVAKSGPSDYLGCLNRWAMAVGQENIVVLPYEKEQMNQGIISSFLDAVGLAPEAAMRGGVAPTVNVTMQTELIEFLRIANGCGLSKEEHSILLGALRNLSTRAGKSDYLTFRNAFSPEERRSILAACEEDNRQIAITYLNRGDGQLFYDPPPDDDPSWRPMDLSVPALAQIIATLWIEQQRSIDNLIQFADRELNDKLIGFLYGKYVQEKGQKPHNSP